MSYISFTSPEVFKECGVRSELEDYHTHLHEFLEDSFETPRENVYIEEVAYFLFLKTCTIVKF